MPQPMLRLLVCRHGEPRSTELDPGLTSFGLRSARKLGDWAIGQIADVHAIVHTRTQRTLQTATELALMWPALAVGPIDGVPDQVEDWAGFTERLWRVHGGNVVVVGHHTTLQMICRDLLPPPVVPPRPAPCSAVVVQGMPGSEDWRLMAWRSGPLST